MYVRWSHLLIYFCLSYTIYFIYCVYSTRQMLGNLFFSGHPAILLQDSVCSTLSSVRRGHTFIFPQNLSLKCLIIRFLTSVAYYVTVLSFAFIFFFSWGNLSLQSYWGLSCDHGPRIVVMSVMCENNNKAQLWHHNMPRGFVAYYYSVHTVSTYWGLYKVVRIRRSLDIKRPKTACRDRNCE